MDSDTFGAKLVLNTIDKLILGVFALVIVSVFEQHAAQTEKLRDETLAVAQLRTETLMQERDRITAAMRQYFGLLSTIPPSATVNNNAQLEQLSRLRSELQLAVDTMSTLAPAITQKADPLLHQVSKINKMLALKSPSHTQITQQTENLRAKYAEFLLALRDAAIDAVKKDRLSAN